MQRAQRSATSSVPMLRPLLEQKTTRGPLVSRTSPPDVLSYLSSFSQFSPRRPFTRLLNLLSVHSNWPKVQLWLRELTVLRNGERRAGKKMAVRGTLPLLLLPCRYQRLLEGGVSILVSGLWALIPSAEWPLHRHDGGLVESQASTSVSLKWAQELYIINMNVRFIIKSHGFYINTYHTHRYYTPIIGFGIAHFQVDLE